MKNVILTTLLLAFATPAFAHVDYHPGIFNMDDDFTYYGGVAIGKMGSSFSKVKLSHSDLGYDAYLGMQMNKLLGTELFYNSDNLLNSVGENVSFSNYGLVGTIGNTLPDHNWKVSDWRVAGRLGYAINRFSENDPNALLPSSSNSFGGPTYGLGISYKASSTIYVSLDYNAYRSEMITQTQVGSVDEKGYMRNLSLGIRFGF